MVNCLEATAGERLGGRGWGWGLNLPLKPRTPGLTAPTPTSLPSPPLTPLQTHPRIFFPPFMAPSLQQSLWSDVTPKGRGLRLGPCLAHLATPADFGPFWANGEPRSGTQQSRQPWSPHIGGWPPPVPRVCTCLGRQSGGSRCEPG